MNNFDYKNMTPFKWFVLENFPFIENDFEAINNYHLFSKVVEYLNKTIDNMNLTGEQMENVTNAMTELQNYVNNYFDNLDVQDEINNKLDEMSTNGTLNSILNNFIGYKLYAPKLSNSTDLGSMSLLVFPNGYTILFDCGYTGQETAIENFMTEKNITHLDVVIVSHFHADHSGCFEFIAENYCNENTLFFRQMQCDYSQFTSEQSQAYNQEQTYINTLSTLGYSSNSRIPTQNETVSLSNGMIKLRFLNTDSDFASSYYSAFSDTNVAGYQYSTLNNFSLICEVSAFNKKLLLTGDIETQAQINNEPFIQKCDIMQVPHHNWNHNGYYKFFDKIKPDIAYFNRNTIQNDYYIYWNKYLKQRLGYVPTYYNYSDNLEIDITNVGISIEKGSIDSTYTIPSANQQINCFLPYCTNYTTPFFSYGEWSIKDLIGLINECEGKVFTTLLTPNSRYTKLNQEIQAMTGASTNWLLRTFYRGFELQRLSNWDGAIYKFLNTFNYDDTSTYNSNFIKTIAPFDNKSINENLDVAIGAHATLTNPLRIPPTLQCTIRTWVGEDTSNYIDYTFIVKNVGGVTYVGEDTAFTYDTTSQKTFLRNARIQLRLSGSDVYVDSCSSIVYNATDNTITNRTGKLIKLNSTALI